MSFQSIINGIFPLDFTIVEELEQMAEYQHLYKGEHLTTEGSSYAFEVIVTKGLLRAYHKTADDYEYNSNFYYEGQFLSPHFARTQNSTSIVNIQALEETEVVVFEETAFTRMRHKHQELLKLGNHVAQQELIHKSKKELLMATRTAHERYENFTKEFPLLNNRIPLQQIAMYLGISPVSLSRIRSKRN